MIHWNNLYVVKSRCYTAYVTSCDCWHPLHPRGPLMTQNIFKRIRYCSGCPCQSTFRVNIFRSCYTTLATDESLPMCGVLSEYSLAEPILVIIVLTCRMHVPIPGENVRWEEELCCPGLGSSCNSWTARALSETWWQGEPTEPSSRVEWTESCRTSQALLIALRPEAFS